MNNRYNKITTPPSKEQLKNWLKEKYGDDFEPKFLDNLITKYIESINDHTEFSKKKSIKYVSENFFKLDRIYRKQEKLYWVKRGWDEKTSETKRII